MVGGQMNIESIISFMATWTIVGVIACALLPRTEWKTELRRSLFILLGGPGVWFVAMVVYFEDKFLGIDRNNQ